MATKSVPPSFPTDETPQNPATEVATPKSEGHQDPKNMSPPSVFVNSEPIREDQVQNAVKFLSHPKVRGSPVMYRRSFLERKGLTKEEIDEAFRRVPDPTPTVSTGQPASANQDAQLNSSNLQQQAPTQALQPAAATSAGAISNLRARYRFGWQQALLAVGLLAVSGAGTAVVFKNAVVPRLKSWIRKVVSEEDEDLVKNTSTKTSLAEEATAAAKAAAAAAADVALTSQDMLISKNGEKKYFEELMSLLGVQVQEMKLMSDAIRKLEGKNSISVQDHRFSHNSSMPPYANGKSDFNLNSARPFSPPAPVEPSVAPHPKSYTEIMSMVQREEKPSNIREVNDLPSNPNQSVPNPSLAARPKPWQVGQVQSSSSNYTLQSQDNGLINNQTNRDISVPWWQQKQSNNVRINEIESGEEYNVGSSVVQSIDRPIQRSWVPPQPPPVAMAEAAAAIRQPKKSTFQSETLTDDQFLARSSEIANELQRVTKISELGGVQEANGGSSVQNTEIQTEESSSYVEA